MLLVPLPFRPSGYESMDGLLIKYKYFKLKYRNKLLKMHVVIEKKVI